MEYDEIIDEYEDGTEDEFYLSDFIERISEEIIFPVELEALNSNWRGDNGYTTANDAEELINKCLSFDNDHLSFRKNDQGYYIRTASHDVPQGFNIYITEECEKVFV